MTLISFQTPTSILILPKLNFSLEWTVKFNIALFTRTARVPMPRKPRQPRHTISGALRRDAFK